MLMIWSILCTVSIRCLTCATGLIDFGFWVECTEAIYELCVEMRCSGWSYQLFMDVEWEFWWLSLLAVNDWWFYCWWMCWTRWYILLLVRLCIDLSKLLLCSKCLSCWWWICSVCCEQPEKVKPLRHRWSCGWDGCLGMCLFPMQP